MDWIAAATKTITYGNDHQLVTRIINGNAVSGSPSMRPGDTPRDCRKYGTGPKDGFSMNSQMLPTTAIDSVQGNSASTRIAVPNRPTPLNNRAAPMPKTIENTSEP